MSGLDWLLDPFRKLHRKWYRFRYRKLSMNVVDDIPDQIAPGTLYLIGEDNDYWAVSMRCPCGCGDTITLNLIGPHPVWKIKTKQRGKLSLYPSVHRLTGCRSHYWVRNNALIWAYDE